MKLLIRNLARNTQQDALLKLFEVHGTVQECTIVMDRSSGSSKGFGFVEMPKAGEAKVAMKALNATLLDGHRIRVKRAEKKTDSKD